MITTKTGVTEKRIIVEKSTETIKTPEELVDFRDKVNSGLSYEGKTINLGANIDLSGVCGENIGNWTPIGNPSTTYFRGTFDGNYYTISNIYINTTKSRQGLFCFNSATIRCLYVEGGSVSGGEILQ